MKLVTTIGQTTYKIELPEPLTDGMTFTLSLDGKPRRAIWRSAAGSLVLVDEQGVERNLPLRGTRVARFDGDTDTKVDAGVHLGAGRMAALKATVAPDLPGAKQAGAGGTQAARVIRSQITGKILKVMVKPGDAVQGGETLLLIEAMKMENRVFAPGPGRVTGVSVKEGDGVATGKELLRLDAP